MLTRRTFIASVAATAAGATRDEGFVMTVRGRVRPDRLGLVLPHEHVMSTFGNQPAERAAYDTEALLAQVLPYLAKIRSLGAGTIVDATAARFGRAPALLRTISERSGLHILTNTGWYGAADDRYVPGVAFLESADQIAARWVAEWRDGIGGTGIRPGFIKTGVDAGELSDIDRTLFTAAVRTHQQTGLTVAVHTGNSTAAAAQQLEILAKEAVSPEAWVWVHAHAVSDADALLRALRAGAWISLDGIQPGTVPRHLELLQLAKREGKLSQVLLSHDGNSFRPGANEPRPYEALFTEVIPALRELGFSATEIRGLTHTNPQKAFAVRRRPARA